MDVDDFYDKYVSPEDFREHGESEFIEDSNSLEGVTLNDVREAFGAVMAGEEHWFNTAGQDPEALHGSMACAVISTFLNELEEGQDNHQRREEQDGNTTG